MITRDQQLEHARLLAQAIEQYSKMSRDVCFNPYDPESRPTSKQVEIFKDISRVQYRYVVAGNQSGKSALAAREIAWILNGNHPYWKRPVEWGTEPYMIIIAGQDRKMMELELWEKKLKPFLNPDDWKEVRQGQALQHCTHKTTGDQIIFISHSDSSERNRKFMQGYVAHYVWLDEMPGSFVILEELQRRVDSKQGYLLATFTPKFKNMQIRKIVDSAKEPTSKKYSMSKLDNPIFAQRKQAEIDKLHGYAESYRNTVLYGDWSVGEDAVYHFNPETMMQPLPESYSHQWRHVEAVDPALKSKFGFTLWAEDPQTGIWYLVRSDYIEGIYDPQSVYQRVQDITKPYNIVMRVCDPHEVWYIETANSNQCRPAYITPYKKNERKGELIKNFQASLGKDIIIPGFNLKFLEEIEDCRWSETADNKIVNASSFHLLDSAQYFRDCRPGWDGPSSTPDTFHAWLYQANEKRKAAELQAAKQAQAKKNWRIQRTWSGARRRK